MDGHRSGFGRSENIERTAAGGGGSPATALEDRSKNGSPSRAAEPNWSERKAPELFSFKGEGDFVEGILIQAGLVEITDKDTGKPKRVMQYVIQGKDTTWKLIGTWDINQKLTPGDQNSLVRITYTGENKEVRKGDNFLKNFEVLVAPRPSRATRTGDGTEITDEDIPF